GGRTRASLVLLKRRRTSADMGLSGVTPGLRSRANSGVFTAILEKPASTKYLICRSVAYHGEVERTLRARLKILVSVVRFRPWPPDSQWVGMTNPSLRPRRGHGWSNRSRSHPSSAAPAFSGSDRA